MPISGGILCADATGSNHCGQTIVTKIEPDDFLHSLDPKADVSERMPPAAIDVRI
jgi:hypothetical protein